jgi:hypothetical protein
MLATKIWPLVSFVSRWLLSSRSAVHRQPVRSSLPPLSRVGAAALIRTPVRRTHLR